MECLVWIFDYGASKQEREWIFRVHSRILWDFQQITGWRGKKSNCKCIKEIEKEKEKLWTNHWKVFLLRIMFKWLNWSILQLLLEYQNDSYTIRSLSVIILWIIPSPAQLFISVFISLFLETVVFHYKGNFEKEDTLLLLCHAFLHESGRKWMMQATSFWCDLYEMEAFSIFPLCALVLNCKYSFSHIFKSCFDSM